MNKLSQIKKQIKKEKNWKAYKVRFEHKQMKFLFSKIALLLDDEINLKFLHDQELKLVNVEISNEMFIEVFKSLEDKIDFKCNWELFGKFIWFVYQTSTYWKDSKKNNHNIFTPENHLELNQTKRDLYQQWIKSIDKKNRYFNTSVIAISKLVF